MPDPGDSTADGNTTDLADATPAAVAAADVASDVASDVAYVIYLVPFWWSNSCIDSLLVYLETWVPTSQSEREKEGELNKMTLTGGDYFHSSTTG